MLQKNQDIFEILLSAVSEAVLVVDENQMIMETNASAKDIFGYERKELIGKHLNILIPKKYHSNHSSHFNSFVKKGEKKQMAFGRCIYGVRKDNTIFPMEAGLNPFSIYGKKFVMAIFVDISERKKQELEIKKLNAQLEKKIRQRTQKLKNTVDKLQLVNLELDSEIKRRIEAEQEIKTSLKKEQELNELKTKFLSLVSHEFKTPLSGILTSAMLLGKYKLEEQQEKRNKHVKTIIDKVYYLDNILNDFLSVEKLEKGKVTYNSNTFKLSKVVNEVVYNTNMLLKEGQKINYPENIDEFSLYHDEKIIELILSNVIFNAVKYSSENTVVDIEIMQNEKNTIFIVKDEGIGIPTKDQSNIFDRYFRAENVLSTQGTGIGLNIVKNHLEEIGGTITFKSEEHVGTTFTITIPNKSIV